MTMCEEPSATLPWDPLREQDWHSLGGFGDETVMEGALWDSVGDGVVGNGNNQNSDGLPQSETTGRIETTCIPKDGNHHKHGAARV